MATNKILNNFLFDPLQDLHEKMNFGSSYADKNYIDKQNISCKPKPIKSSNPKRPSNPFFLFRKWKWKQISKDYKNIDQAKVSIILGNSWKSLSEYEKEYWREKALQELNKHKQLYPGYKYSPSKKMKK